MTDYDVIPYPGVPHVQSHPDRLATVARLCAADPAPPAIETSRVLELGCARGDNLIPLGLSQPNAEFVGVDLSRRQIEEGNRTRDQLGAGNVRLEALDLCDIDASWGEFDYILAHGVYSWVPAEVRDRLLALCRERLRPNGVAYVSYNVYPGWRQREVIRDLLLYHTDKIDDPHARLEQAVAILAFLRQSIPDELTHYRRSVDEVQQTLDEAPERIHWLFHDLMAEFNAPVYFWQFAAHAERHGLQFLAEADFTAMQTHRLAPQVAKTLEGLGEDLVRREQYLDFIKNRQFRQTLLCHDSVRLDRRLSPSRLNGLHVATELQPVSQATATEFASTNPLAFRSPDGVEIATTDPLTKAAFLALSRGWPESIRFEDLAGVARLELGQDGFSTQELDEAVLQSYTAGLLELRLSKPRFAASAGERPHASPWARHQAAAGGRVTNLRHSQVQMNDFNRHLLCLLDGSRDRAALVDALTDRVEQAGTTVKRGDEVVNGRAALRSFVQETLEQDLRSAARAALLIA